MTLPRATYRLQFRNGMDFDKAASLAPYFGDLGVSHLYASPVFQATAGSAHGYDVTDHNRFDESLGGIDGFLHLSAALKQQNLGLILDIVPNHMAASPQNPWWRDVLRHGKSSAYARHFDIDWTRPKLTIPVLGRPFGKALAAGDFSLGRAADGPVWRYRDQAFPLDPRTWPLVVGAAGMSLPADWRLSEADAGRLDTLLQETSRDPERMIAIHKAQPWRLVFWRAARDSLSYRRFFEIANLVGVRVEEPGVFDDVHRLLFDMVGAGHVDGVRVDHVDGLADPAGYLDRLSRALPRDIPIWVEKILARGEALPTAWPVAGTTGYEFTDAVTCVLTNPEAVPSLDRAYADFTGHDHDYLQMLAAAKREVLTRNLATELGTLIRLASNALSGDPSARDWGQDLLQRAIVALLCAMPVYRTYLSAAGSLDRSQDSAILRHAAGIARTDDALDDPTVVDVVVDCLLGHSGSAADASRTRFQQTSGALMAKAVEDTLFYRFHRLISANEVGGDPSEPAWTPEKFHARMLRRAADQPHGLNATATHDTKRGEDARMRIAAISEAPDAWADSVKSFDAAIGDSADVARVDAETRWLFYQALLGAWTQSADQNLVSRVSAFLIKAARESQTRTSWVKPDPKYEDVLRRFAEQTLSCRPFLDPFAAAAARFVPIGECKSIVQLALKLTMPGVPDIYQGTEFADLSFVDPDNRRPVDFGRRHELIKRGGSGSPSSFDDIKMSLLRFGLGLRRGHPDVFSGSYLPLGKNDSTGQRSLAFARRGHSAILIVTADLSGTSAAPEAGVLAEVADAVRNLRPTRSFPPSPPHGMPPARECNARSSIRAVTIRLFEAA